MAISRQQLAKELEPGLNALFGLEYQNYENQHLEIFDVENSDRAFEEEVMLSGFANAAVKSEGSAVTFDSAQTDVGKVADTVATHSGSTITGISGIELDVSDLAATDGQLRVTGFTGDPSNNELGTTHTNYVVYFNEHAYNHNE